MDVAVPSLEAQVDAVVKRLASIKAKAKEVADLAPIPGVVQKPAPLRVVITREMFDDWATITLDDGTTENLEPDELRLWFRIRGANMEVVEKALDYCWNFRKSIVVIGNPKYPPKSRLEPKI